MTKENAAAKLKRQMAEAEAERERWLREKVCELVSAGDQPAVAVELAIAEQAKIKEAMRLVDELVAAGKLK